MSASGAGKKTNPGHEIMVLRDAERNCINYDNNTFTYRLLISVREEAGRGKDEERNEK